MRQGIISLIAFSLVSLLAMSSMCDAFDPLPSGCVSSCSGKSECLSCMDECSAYIANYSGIDPVLEKIRLREYVNITHPDYNNKSLMRLEGCWCSACCEYGFDGNLTHPCIYMCPCQIFDSNTTTTTLEPNIRPQLNESLGTLESSGNFALCLFLNILWMVVPAIAALVIIYSGFKYMSSDTDPSVRDRARKSIIYAIVGLTFSVTACPAMDYLITGTDITPFEDSCKCYQMMDLGNSSAPEMPELPNITINYTTTSLRVIETRATTTTTTTTTTTLKPETPCDKFKASGTLPTDFSWHNVDGKDYMTGVRDQGDCGSCWAHGEMAAVEGQYKIEIDDPSFEFDLSEQFLVSTCFSIADCNGLTFGTQDQLHNYMKSTGSPDESCYPYLAANSKCSDRCSDWDTRVWRITSWSKSSSARDAVKENVLCKGPMWVASPSWGHAICLVGWDTQGWVIKNSWGYDWGTGGYGTVPYTHSYANMINYAYNVAGVTPPS